MKLLFCFLFVALVSTQVEAQPASDELAAKRAVELLERVEQGKDGAYDVMKKFAECAGLYNALANYVDALNSKAMATNLRNTGRGAKFVAMFFWSSYSKNPKDAVSGIIGGTQDFYASTLSYGGVQHKQITDKMFYCGSLTTLQARVVDQIRKSY